jgi:predicted nucleic acid-binding protein
MIVVSDTSPLHYLLLLDRVELLPKLYGNIIIPEVVRDEMLATGAPVILQQWIQKPPDWLDICIVELPTNLDLMRLDPGERAAIQLALHVQADLLIVDDKPARQAATALGINITGLLGILSEASRLGEIDLSSTIAQLMNQTNFRASPRLLEALLNNHRIGN